MIVPAVISCSSASPGSATIMTTPTTKTRAVAGIGVPVRGLTRRISRWAGKRPSRDIAKTIREHEALITVPAPKNATVIATRSTFSITDPSCSLMIAATGDSLAVTPGNVLDGDREADQEDDPQHPGRRDGSDDRARDAAKGPPGRTRAHARLGPLTRTAQETTSPFREEGASIRRAGRAGHQNGLSGRGRSPQAPEPRS